MHKKLIIFLLIILIIIPNVNNIYAVTTNCQSILLFELNSQSILYSKSANKKMYPASITKIMTAILALELGNLDDEITVDDETPYEIYGSHIALEPGEVLSLKDLLYALMLPSANDAASVIAKKYGGSIEGFAKLMNDKAKELGANDTNFVNPHGLHDDNHYTTASDLMKIVTYAMKNETFREIVKTPRYEIPATNKKEARAIITTNNLLLNTSTSYIQVDGKYISREYEGAAGIKNGYTPQAGNCLISYVEKNGMGLVAIVLNGSGTELYTDTHNLFNYGFDNFELKYIAKANEFVKEIEVLDGTEKIALVTESDTQVVLEKGTSIELTPSIKLNEITLPIKKGDVLGKIEYKQGDNVVASTNIISTSTVDSVEASKYITDNTSPNESNIPTPIKVIIAIIIGIILLRIYNKIRIYLIRKKRKKRRAELRKEFLNRQIDK